MSMTRRDLLVAAGASVGYFGTTSVLRAGTARQRPKVLFFTKSSGFQHSVVNRGGEALSFAERIFIEAGARHGYDVTASKDGTLFDPDQISEWDAFAFYTTGDLTTPGTDGTTPMTPVGKKAFLDAIRAGTGFVGMHCASDTFHSSPNGPPSEYIQMIGGEFSGHGAQQNKPIKVVDTEFPGVSSFGSGFSMLEEWYAFRNLSPEMHVIMVQETGTMEGKDYDRPNYPMTWSKTFGDGKVFYTSLGHREDVWTNPKFQGLLMSGLDFVRGEVQGSLEVDIDKVTPGYQQVGR